MKYFVVSAFALAGILFLSLRNSGYESNTLERTPKSSVINDINEQQFTDYWYQGEGELSGYELEQVRYGEIHNGEAVLIFVTEAFSKEKQVKLDDPGKSKRDKQTVLKLNSTRKFHTGIYPYSMMTSVFNPVSLEKRRSAVKLSSSGQEWCGQVYTQMNLQGSNYEVKSFSYFESEGDQKYTLQRHFLEDEIFNLIRMNPELLPLGEIKIIPSAVVSRFKHEQFTTYDVEATIGDIQWNEKKLNVYTINYLHNGRTLKIYFEPEFPFIIEGWEDKYSSFGSDPLTTVAKRKNTIKSAYWTKNSNSDRELYDQLFQ